MKTTLQPRLGQGRRRARIALYREDGYAPVGKLALFFKETGLQNQRVVAVDDVKRVSMRIVDEGAVPVAIGVQDAGRRKAVASS